MRNLLSILALSAFAASAHEPQNYEPLINGFTNRDTFRLTFQETSSAAHRLIRTSGFTPSPANDGTRPWCPRPFLFPAATLRSKPGASRHPPAYATRRALSAPTKNLLSGVWLPTKCGSTSTPRPGTWSAFWVHSWNMTGNVSGNLVNRPDIVGSEIDAIEHRAVDQNGSDISTGGFHAVHWNGYCAAHEANGTMDWTSNVANGFHTFGLLWRYLSPVLPRRQQDLDVHQRQRHLVDRAVHDPEHRSARRKLGGQIPAGGYGSYGAF